MIKLEEGKEYKTKGGDKVVNVRYEKEDNYDFSADIAGGSRNKIYQSNGIHGGGVVVNIPDYDIVSLWYEPETPAITKGVKHDSGKIIAGVLFEDFPRALMGLCEVATIGAEKYSRNDWQHVEDAHRRYSDAMVRHMLAKGSGEINDPESGIPHVFHIAWNALAIAELEAKEKVNV